MFVSKSRLLALGLLTAGLGTAAALGSAAPHLRGALASGAPGAVGGTAPVESLRNADRADKREEARPPASGVRVEAPSTAVRVDKDRGEVSVSAPYTDVHVDPDKGRVRVRAPFVDLDIRW